MKTIKEIIIHAKKNNLDLSKLIRKFLKERPKHSESGVYNGN